MQAHRSLWRRLGGTLEDLELDSFLLSAKHNNHKLRALAPCGRIAALQSGLVDSNSLLPSREDVQSIMSRIASFEKVIVSKN